jgi:hypothetical protein
VGFLPGKKEKSSPTTKRAFARRFTEEETTVRESYHGALRSELDEPSRLPGAFEQLIEQVGQARHGFERGAITKIQLAAVLQGLRVVAPDGAEWTMGATSGRWYRRPIGGAWVPALPPEADDEGRASFQQGSTPSHDNDDLLANIDEMLRNGVDLFDDSQQAAVPTENISPWPTVQSGASHAEPVSFQASPTSVVDEHGSWDSSWDARSSSAVADSGDDDAITAFGDPAPIDGGGWAAWGAAPR